VLSLACCKFRLWRRLGCRRIYRLVRSNGQQLQAVDRPAGCLGEAATRAKDRAEELGSRTTLARHAISCPVVRRGKDGEELELSAGWGRGCGPRRARANGRNWQ
jgi:hypothetical protein